MLYKFADSLYTLFQNEAGPPTLCCGSHGASTPLPSTGAKPVRVRDNRSSGRQHARGGVALDSTGIRPLPTRTGIEACRRLVRPGPRAAGSVQPPSDFPEILNGQNGNSVYNHSVVSL